MNSVRFLRRGGLVLAATALAAIPAVSSASRPEGRVVYGVNGNTTPVERVLPDGAGSFGSEASTVTGSTPVVVRTVSAPTRNERLVGYVNASGTLQIMRWDGSTWTNEWSVAVGGNGANGRRFDIAYENLSGDAVVLYSNNTAGTNELRYRTWNGSAWTNATSLDVARITATPIWVKMRSKPGSDEIAALVADNATAPGDLTAVIWSGSAWGGEPASALSTTLDYALAVGDVDCFDLAYEGVSGDLLVVWADNSGANFTNGVRYATRVGTTWTLNQTPGTFADDAHNLDLCADPGSDYILFGSIGRGGSDYQHGAWSGTGWVNAAANADQTAAQPAAGSHMVACGWLTSGATTRGVIAYSDAANAAIDHYVYTPGTGFALGTDFARGGTSGTDYQIRIEQDPSSVDRLMLVVADSNADLYAKSATVDGAGNVTWADADGGAALNATLTGTTGQAFDFSFDLYVAPTVVLADFRTGSSETGSSTIPPGGTAQLDTFALAVSMGTATVTGITINVPSGATNLASVTIRGGAGCTGATYHSLANPANGANVVATLDSSITVGTTQSDYYVCVTAKDHAGVVGSPAIGGTVSNPVASGYVTTGADTGSGTVIVDNTAPAAPTGLAGVAGSGQVVLAWTGESADADFTTGGEVVVLRKVGSAPTEVPVEGTDYAGGETVGTATVACVAVPGARTCTASGLTNGQDYYFVAFARDVRLNYSIASTSTGPHTPALPTLTLANFRSGSSETASSTIAPGAAAQADTFALATNGGTATVTGLTIDIPSGAANLASVSLRGGAGCTGTTYHSLANPVDGANVIAALSTSISAGTSQTDFYVCVTAKGHAAVTGSPAITATVSAPVAAGYTIAGTDTGSGTVTIDNTAPGAITGLSGAVGNGQIVLSWTGEPADADFTVGGEVVVLRKVGSAPTEVPAEGMDYAGGETVGTSAVACVAAPGARTCTASGLTNGQQYYFVAFARDVRLNYSSASAATGPHAPSLPSLTLTDGTDPSPSTACPGATAAVDGFTLQAGSGTADVAGVTVTLAPAGTWENVGIVRVQCGAAVGTTSPVASDVVPVAIAVSVGSGSATDCTVSFGAKSHDQLTSAGEIPVRATVTNVAVTGYVLAGTDGGSATVTIDNQAPASILALGASGADGRVDLAWANPGSDFGQTILVRKQGSAVTFAPTDGTDYLLNATPVAGETVIYAGAGTAHGDTPLTNGTAYHYMVVARDACNNWGGAAIASATPSAFIGEGHTTENSARPVVAIVNPTKGGVVKAPFKVQARIFSPQGQAVTAELLVDGAPAEMTPSSQYGTTESSGVWEHQVNVLAAGAHVLRVRAVNASGTVYSAEVPVTVPASASGDGNLLVRDNASQLCSDCHSMPSHSSESAGAKWGSWATTCRDCHTPHGTRNIALVAEQITPPALAGPQTPKPVVFYDRSGYGPTSYANASGTGPCQVCHTRTVYFNADGSGADHNPTSNCGGCHKHAKGLAANCVECHGTEGRAKGASVAGTVDARLEAAPPKDTDSNPANDAVREGAHLAHVNQGTYRTNALACADCHPRPNDHQGTRDAAWSTLAAAGGVSPTPAAGADAYSDAWELAPGCTNWCHGAGLAGGGGTDTSPAWTGGPSEATCGKCHGTPPPADATDAGDHPNNTACALCHGAGYAQGSLDATAKGTHVDGTVQKPANGCTACHGKLAGLGGVAAGSTNPEAAPGYDDLSVDTRGSSDRSSPGVGGHVKHVRDGMMAGKACAVCHPHPTDGDTLHANGGATQLAWTLPASAGGVSPSYVAGSCTNYCHSSGDPMGAAVPATTPIAWTSQSALGCTSCHLSAAIATNAHDVHVGGFGGTCSQCHVDTTSNGSSIVAGGGLHVNGGNDVAFDASSAFVQGAGYAGGQCSNTYCHSAGTDRTPPYASGPSVAWTGSTSCTSCHGGPVGAGQIASGRHPNHVNVAGTIGGAAGTNMECGTCHAGTVAAGTNAPVTGAGNHVDRIATVAFDPAYGGTFAQGATEGSGTCSTTYCHSSGQDPGAAPAIIEYQAVAWDGPALDCNGCHGRHSDDEFAAIGGSPNYANGGEGAPKANSHRAHVTAATDCVKCHAGTAAAAGNAILSTSALHLDGSRQVQIVAAYDGDGGATNNWDPAQKKCNSVTCHGAGEPRWGGPAQTCASCHEGTGDQDDFAAGNYGNGTHARIDTTEWNAFGHGQASVGLGGPDECLYCHGGAGVTHGLAANPWRLANYDAGVSNGNGVCLACHQGTGYDPDGAGGSAFANVVASKKIDAWHAGADHTTKNGGQRCWDCHDPHGDDDSVAGGAGVGNIKMIGRDVLANSTDAYGRGARVATSVSFTTNATGAGYAKTANPYNGVCQVCHTSTNHWRADGTLQHQASVKCVACHDHDKPAADAFKESTACNACHAAVPTTPATGAHAKHVGVAVPTSYGDATIDPAAGAQYGYGCGVCHSTTAGNHMNHAGAQPYVVTVDFAYDAAIYTQGAAKANETGLTGLLFQYSNGGCAATYCHDPQGATYNAGVAVTWGQSAGIPLACNACHDDATNQASTLLPGAHDKHATTAAGAYNYTCEKCHAVTAASNVALNDRRQHADNDKNDVDFGTHGGVDQSGGAWASGSGTCGSTYCHSQGTSTTSFVAPNTNLVWATGTSTCTSCHNSNAAEATLYMQTGKHAAHVKQAAYLGTDFRCARCHAVTSDAASDTALHATTGRANHVDGTATVSMSDGGNWSRPNCTNTYCHSNGTETLTAGDYVNPPAWNGVGTLDDDCMQCHGTEAGSVAGEPRYANGAPADDARNSHAKHVASNTSCVTCHDSTVDGTGSLVPGGTHLDGNVQITVGGKIGGYTPAGERCSSISCHGGNQADWGGPPLTCKQCHSSPTGETDDFLAEFWRNGTTATINEAEWLYSGHGKTAGNYDITGNPPAAFSITVAGTTECLYCHDGDVAHQTDANPSNPYRLRGASVSADGRTFDAYDTASPNATCENCHKTGGLGVDPDGASAAVQKSGTVKMEKAHAGAKHTQATLGGKFCWDCHDPHGDRISTGGNIAMVRSYVFQTQDGVFGYLGASGIQRNVTYTTEAGGGPGAGRAVEGTSSPRVGICQACHGPTTETYWTKYWNRNGQDDPDGPGGANPVASAHNSTSATVPYCISCHKHQDGFKGAGQCTDCHGDPQGIRVAVTGDFVRQSRHVSNGTTTSIVTNYDCILCHAEGDPSSSGSGATIDIKTDSSRHGGDGGTTTVDLRNVDAPNGDGVAAAWPGERGVTLPNGATYTAARDAMDTFCLNCHDDDGAASITVNATTDGMLTSPGFWLYANAGQVSRDGSSVVTVNTTAPHGLATNNTVLLEVPTEANFPPGVKTVTVTSTTQFTYPETGTAVSSTRALKFIRVAQSNSGQTTRVANGVRVTVNTTQAHGFVVGDKVLLRTGANTTTGTYYFRAGVKTVATAPSGTQFTYDEPLSPAVNPTAATPSTQILLFTKSIDRAVTPFNPADNLKSYRESTALKDWRWISNGRVIDVKGQFNAANATGKNWASHHNLNQFTKRYGSRNATAWPNTAWTTWTTREGQSIQTAGETAGLHCSDCHLNEANAHGSVNTYYMLSNSSGSDTAFTGTSSSSSTDICVKCHATGTYSLSNSSTASRTDAHNASGGRCDRWNQSDIAYLASNGTTTTISCLGCHGGASPGMIHGTNGTFQPGMGAFVSKQYRFMGGGGSMRWYSPSGTTTVSEASWEGTTSVACYTISSTTDTFGGCDQHGSLSSTTPNNGRQRLLDY